MLTFLRKPFSNSGITAPPTRAARFLDDWCRQVMRSRIEPMKKIARSLRDHRELILNYFRAQKLLSSGVPAFGGRFRASLTIGWAEIFGSPNDLEKPLAS